jgi:hypothetical protein
VIKTHELYFHNPAARAVKKLSKRELFTSSRDFKDLNEKKVL